MIVPMKKVVIIVCAADRLTAVSHVRTAGIMHVEQGAAPERKSVSHLYDDAALVAKTLALLGSRTGHEATMSGPAPADWKVWCHDVQELFKKQAAVHEEAARLQQHRASWESLDIDPARIEQLATAGIVAGLYRIPQKALATLPQGALVRILDRHRACTRTVVITRGDQPIPFERIPWPEMSVAAMRERADALQQERCLIEERIEHARRWRTWLQKKHEWLTKEIAFHEAVKGMAEDRELACLSGYVPVPLLENLMGVARHERWGMVVRDPADDDEVPVLLHNPRWVTLINPVLRLLEVVPGYRELDISVLFLIFLSVFFGMIIGDAGYGAVYGIVSLVARYTIGAQLSPEQKKIFGLLYVFSSCAILWGLCSGTVFGQVWYTHAGYRALVPPLTDARAVQTICFFLGASHLTIAHLWKIAVLWPSRPAWAECGWIAVLWTGFFVAKTFILGDAFPSWGMWLLAAGIIAVVTCAHPHPHVCVSIGKGLATVALNLVNNFTDVISYIRLFAVGLAGVAIADTVNTLAGSVGGTSIVMVLVLGIGHTLNLILGPMSVLVHGVRLNVLEFSGHSGVTWSGRRYQPLSE